MSTIVMEREDEAISAEGYECVGADDASATGQGARMAYEDDLTQIAQLLDARRYLYLLFHKALGGEPTGELLAALSSQGTMDALAPYAHEDPVMSQFAAYARSLAPRANDAAFISEVASEYTRHFIGPDPLRALPWESPYRSHQLSLFQKSTVEVRRIYRAHGLAPKKLHRVPDDHVSLMCAFMASESADTQRAFSSFSRQVGRAVEPLRTNLMAQGRFVHAHLNDWLDEFAHRSCLLNPLRKGTQDLYPQLAQALAAFTHLDEVFLQEAVLWLDALEEPEDFAMDSPLASSVCLREIGTVSDGWETKCCNLQGIRLFGLEDNELEAIDPA